MLEKIKPYGVEVTKQIKMAIRDYTKHKDFNLDTIDVRLKSTPNYVKYLKHLSSVQLAEGEMNTYNVLQMVISDLEQSILENNKK